MKTKKLNKNAKLWVKALRSKKYKQGKGQLLKKGKFCCLGVACDLFCKKVKNIKSKGKNNYDGEIHSLPEIVQKWLGLTTRNGQYDLPTTVFVKTSLVIQNDSYEKTFEEIADIIESKPQGLFKRGR